MRAMIDFIAYLVYVSLLLCFEKSYIREYAMLPFSIPRIEESSSKYYIPTARMYSLSQLKHSKILFNLILRMNRVNKSLFFR